jgi:hypothetical protein
MELDPKDYDVVKLLTKLKGTNDAYPAELLNPRRQTYVRRVAEIGLGFGVAAGLKTTIKSGRKAGSLSTTAGGLIEAALVMAIIAEAGAAAYIYRDELTALLRSNISQPTLVEITSAPETEFSPKLPGMDFGDPEETTATPPVTGTPSGTPVPSAAGNTTNQNNQGSQGLSTPDPNGNNGNHFGQTPKPDRTRNPGNNDNDNNNDKGKGKNK